MLCDWSTDFQLRRDSLPDKACGKESERPDAKNIGNRTLWKMIPLQLRYEVSSLLLLFFFFDSPGRGSCAEVLVQLIGGEAEFS